VTASIGITSMPVTMGDSPAEFWKTLYEEADTYMYLAKERGRNQVALAPRLIRNPQVS
jgi:GGDEF domain-containing protein